MLETIFEEMKVDWASVREDEVGFQLSRIAHLTFLVANQDSQIIQLAENSICCGTVYEVDVIGLAHCNRSFSIKVAINISHWHSNQSRCA